MKNITETQPATPFRKFKELTERLVAVPKKELDKKILEYENSKTSRKKQKKGKVRS